MKKIAAYIVISLFVLFIIAQFIPVDKSNPLVNGEIPAPDEVKNILKTSCYDCHSHETQWPWYSNVAPVSWLVARDVNEGREHLNFSTWQNYSPEKIKENLEEIIEEIEKGKMPMPIYTPLHPEAKLTAEKIQILKKWAEDYPVFKGGEKSKKKKKWNDLALIDSDNHTENID